MSAVSLYNLPTEVVYYILGNLDVQTILLSFRYACKRFYTIVNSYNRCDLDLSVISKIDFHRVCRIIRPENIFSLTLSDNDITPGQICLFMSIFNINQFIHLRSLTLVQIDKFELNLLMEQININSLSSLSINIRKNNSKSKDTSTISLLSNIAKANLCRLDLRMWSHEIDGIVWPKQYTLQHLTLGHYLTSKQVSIILCQLSYLQTLVLRNCIVNDTDQTKIPFSDVEKNTNLISLTFKDSRLQMNGLESLLSLTPSLIHLQLTGSVVASDSILDGSRWEEFIQTKLLLLKKFEFFFRTRAEMKQNSINIESLLLPYRTIFWLQHKSWFITCNYIVKTATLRLYSVPVCDSCITYESDFDKVSYTTFPIIDNEPLTMNNVHEVHLDLIQIMATVTRQKIIPSNNHLFTKLNELTLTINDEWPFGSIEFLSALIDLSHLTTLGLYVSFDHSSVLNTINNIGHLLEQAFNVRSLTLSNSLCQGNLNGIVESFCSIIPPRIKHLDIYDMDPDDIKLLLERLQHLSSITFVFFSDMPFSPTEIIEWLSQRKDFTYLIDNCSLSIWLGNNINVQSNFVLTTTISD